MKTRMDHRKETPKESQPATEEVTPSPNQPRALAFEDASVSVEENGVSIRTCNGATLAIQPSCVTWSMTLPFFISSLPAMHEEMGDPWQVQQVRCGDASRHVWRSWVQACGSGALDDSIGSDGLVSCSRGLEESCEEDEVGCLGCHWRRLLS